MNIESLFPIHDVIPALKKGLAEKPLIILQAPPGAGKSTVLPLEIMDERFLHEKKIIILEPRRLAAKSVAERMANLLNEAVGERIGYHIRFEAKVSAKTRIEVVTEGILTRMLQNNNALEDFGLIIFDEFHERSIHADLSLALGLQIQQLLRPELRILIMSATLDSSELAGKLNGAPVIISSGKQFPVQMKYSPQESDQFITDRVSSTIRKVLNEEDGDVLVFLPGAGEIKRVYETLDHGNLGVMVYPLYGDLTFRKQQEAILPRRDGVRKVVLATSIAETSLTIEGIKVVVDSGLSRVPRFDPRSGLTRLETIRVTKDAADQRAGRAGRLGPGVCYRLWTQGQHNFLLEQRTPEILEADLAPFMLELYQWGVSNVRELTWITLPPPGAVMQARELLLQLEAIDEKGITKRGRDMLRLPTHPRLAHMLLIAGEDISEKNKSISLATDVAAILEERDPLDRNAGTDISLRIEALRKWRTKERVSADINVLERIERVAANWRRILKTEEDNSRPLEKEIGRLIWAAYPERIAQQQGKHSTRYKLSTGRMVNLPAADPLAREQWICAAQLDAGVGDGKIFLASAIHPDDLKDHAVEQEVVRWDESRAMVVALKERRLGSLILESKNQSTIDAGKRIDVILERVRETGLHIVGNQQSKENLQSRILSLHFWRPQEKWPALTDHYLLQNLNEWLEPFITNIYKESELRALDIHAMISSILPWELQQKLEHLAPSKIQVPSGSQIAVKYQNDGSPPVVEVRLQEMFGLAETPTVNEGQTKILLQLLSPGYKPVQVTQDLKSFWNTTYHEVRKELRLRYPRHHWPEDPWTAEAVRGAKKRNPN